ncbi:MAG: Ada metal-binding domain-containing protein [Bdellovibrionia bacterium]
MTLAERDICYKAMAARDPRYDGRFYVGVQTTGIYCRPTCPARPKKENVSFYRSQAGAENAGFRPCLRCRPDISPNHSMWEGTAAVVGRAIQIISIGGADDESLERLACRLGVTGRHLRRLFDQHVGAAPIDVATSKRLHIARQLLSQTRISVTDIAFASGFKSIRRFNQSFKDRYRRSPREFRNFEDTDHGEGIRLRLPVLGPYDWEFQLHGRAGHLVSGLESVSEGRFQRVLRFGDRPVFLDVGYDRKTSELDVEVRGALVTDLRPLIATVKHAFDTQLNPAAIELNTKIRLGGVRLPGAFDPFETAVCVILGQLVSTEQAMKKSEKLVQLFGEPIGEPQPGLTHFFPKPEILAEANLRSIGLTRAREAAIRTLSSAVAAKKIDLGPSADFQAMRQALLEIPGIGPWTTEMIAMRCFGDMNAFPASDLIVRRAMAKLRLDHAKWQPWRSYLCLWIWKTYAQSLSKKGERL